MAEKVMVSFEMDNKQFIRALRATKGELGDGLPRAAKKASVSKTLISR